MSPIITGTSDGRNRFGSCSIVIVALCEAAERLQHGGDRCRLAAADIVDAAARAPFQQERVGPHDIAHIGEIALRVEIADRNNLALAALHLDDLPGEGADDETVRLPRPDMIEWPGNHHIEIVRVRVLEGEHLLRRLADRVRVDGMERAILAEGLRLGRRRAVDFVGTDDQAGAPAGRAPGRHRAGAACR